MYRRTYLYIYMYVCIHTGMRTSMHLCLLVYIHAYGYLLPIHMSTCSRLGWDTRAYRFPQDRQVCATKKYGAEEKQGGFFCNATGRSEGCGCRAGAISPGVCSSDHCNGQCNSSGSSHCTRQSSIQFQLSVQQIVQTSFRQSVGHKFARK